MNTLTVADIKRNGFAALDAALAQGVVHLMKRNRPSAVVLSMASYNQLLAQAQRNRASLPPVTGLSMLLAQEPESGEGLDTTAMQLRLAEIKNGWDSR